MRYGSYGTEPAEYAQAEQARQSNQQQDLINLALQLKQMGMGQEQQQWQRGVTEQQMAIQQKEADRAEAIAQKQMQALEDQRQEKARKDKALADLVAKNPDAYMYGVLGFSPEGIQAQTKEATLGAKQKELELANYPEEYKMKKAKFYQDQEYTKQMIDNAKAQNAALRYKLDNPDEKVGAEQFLVQQGAQDYNNAQSYLESILNGQDPADPKKKLKGKDLSDRYIKAFDRFKANGIHIDHSLQYQYLTILGSLHPKMKYDKEAEKYSGDNSYASAYSYHKKLLEGQGAKTAAPSGGGGGIGGFFKGVGAAINKYALTPADEGSVMAGEKGAGAPVQGELPTVTMPGQTGPIAKEPPAAGKTPKPITVVNAKGTRLQLINGQWRPIPKKT
jgi:hypothetical protein